MRFWISRDGMRNSASFQSKNKIFLQFRDPCKPNRCPEGTVCVDIPIMDGDYADDGGEKLTFACV